MVMGVFPYRHTDLGQCTPRQLIALLQQARRERHRRQGLAVAAAARGYALAHSDQFGAEIARLEAE